MHFQIHSTIRYYAPYKRYIKQNNKKEVFSIGKNAEFMTRSYFAPTSRNISSETVQIYNIVEDNISVTRLERLTNIGNVAKYTDIIKCEKQL